MVRDGTSSMKVVSLGNSFLAFRSSRMPLGTLGERFGDFLFLDGIAWHSWETVQGLFVPRGCCLALLGNDSGAFCSSWMPLGTLGERFGDLLPPKTLQLWQ